MTSLAAPAPITTTAAPVALPRSQSQWIEPEALRALIKANLGLNARQVSVSKGHTTRWLTVTIRDPKVDVDAVKKFINTFDTMTVDNTDYCEGQSVNVECTQAVNDAHSDPFMQEVRDLIAKVNSRPREEGRSVGERFANGKLLWLDDRGYYVSDPSKNAGTCRGSYCYPADVNAGAEWPIRKLALDVARL